MHLLRKRPRPQVEAVGMNDEIAVLIRRGRFVEQKVRLGPNQLHAVVIHADGSYDDLGVSTNLLTNAGRDLLAAGMGAPGYGVTGTVATNSSSTSLTATGTPFGVDAYKGWIVVAEESTNAPVWGNIGSNTSSVLTVDAWRTGDDTSGTTPGTTANYLILPNARARYIALTSDASAANAANTTLTSEITTNGLGRAAGTYAHTGGTATYTLTKSFSVTGTQNGIHRAGMFTASTLTAAGVMMFETVLNADASVINGDTLQVTWTVTLSG